MATPLNENRGAKMAAVIARMEFTLEQIDKLLVGDDFDRCEIDHLRISIAQRLKESAALFVPTGDSGVSKRARTNSR
jgi:hypothetical protein